MKFPTIPLAGIVVLLPVVRAAIELDIDNPISVKNAAARIAFDMMSNYKGNISGPYNIPGLLEQPPSGYYWWEAGAMFGAMIDYWAYTGDTSYNHVVTEAMLFQANSPMNDFKPLNQSKSLAFWGMAAMRAAEVNFPNPPPGQPQWLALAQAVFNTQARQYDVAPSTCGGGLRWQIFSFNAGYNYKNSISNGCFFNIASRLLRYTGNTTYLEWAERVYEWTESVNLIDKTRPDGIWAIYDGTDERNNCIDHDHNRWSYNVGVYLLGAANIYNYLSSIDSTSPETAKWHSRTTSLLNATSIFFTPTTATSPSIMLEHCERVNKCNTDQRSFKAYLARWMAATTKMAPFSRDYVLQKLRSSAKAAVSTCTGGESGTLCGQKWWSREEGDAVPQPDGWARGWDGSNGVGEQMTALEVVMSLLIEDEPEPFTNSTGGTSPGDYNAGSSTRRTGDIPYSARPATRADRAGAGILTTFILLGVILGTWWVCSEGKSVHFHFEGGREKVVVDDGRS